MKNLHLMYMNSSFNDNIVLELNKNFDNDTNEFIYRVNRKIVEDFENCKIDPDAFNAEFINNNYKSYDHIVLHSLFLSDDELIKLSEEAAKKIIWCVWGHDLYSVKYKTPFKIKAYIKQLIKKVINEASPFIKSVFRCEHLIAYRKRKKAAAKVGLFHSVAIGYSYDEKMIRKKYSNRVPVKIAPYFSNIGRKDFDEIKSDIKKDNRTFNILIGHCGFAFIEHEIYLKKLSAYKNENININLVLSYYYSKERVENIKKMAIDIFGEEKCTVKTEMMPQRDYFEYLSTMDAAIFPYKHQAGLANVWALTYFGAKMFFNPKGVLYKGYKASGVKAFDCRKIGKIPFEDFCSYNEIVDEKNPLFDSYDYDKNISQWKDLLY